MKKYNTFKTNILRYSKNIFLVGATPAPASGPNHSPSGKPIVKLDTLHFDEKTRVNTLVEEMKRRLNKTLDIDLAKIEEQDNKINALRSDLNNLGNLFNQLAIDVTQTNDNLDAMNKGLINRIETQDQEIQDLKDLVGKLVNGEIGKGVKNAQVDADNNLELELSDGDTINAGKINVKDGKDGKDGTDGRDGYDGTKGKSSFEIWLINNPGKTPDDYNETLKGDKGDPGKDGINGADGKSAFEIWLINNPGKTPDDYNETLKGDKGDPGKDGINGADGINGKDGIDGAKGDKGTLGKDGIDGADGINGKDGIDGAKGDKGEEGPSGKIYPPPVPPSTPPIPPHTPPTPPSTPGKIKYVEVVGKGKIDINDFTLIDSTAKREALRKELKTYNGIDTTADRIVAYMEWCSKRQPAHITSYLDDLIYWTGNEIKNSDPKKKIHPVNKHPFVDSNGQSHYYGRKITTGIIPGLVLALKTKPLPSTGKQGHPSKKKTI
jgi:Collagen triple helix repeat (20 copies)